MLTDIPYYPEKLDRLKRHIATTKTLLRSPKLARDNPDLFFQAREQLRSQEGLLKQVQGGVLCVNTHRSP